MVIQEKDQVQLKIVKQQYRGSVKRASDMKMKVELYRVSLLIFFVEKIGHLFIFSNHLHLVNFKLTQWIGEERNEFI